MFIGEVEATQRERWRRSVQCSQERPRPHIGENGGDLFIGGVDAGKFHLFGRFHCSTW